MIDEPDVRDILVQVRCGAAELWLDRGAGTELVAGWRASAAAVRELAVALIAAGGRHLDELQPCADVRLGDGIRVHAALPPVAVFGAAVSIRVPALAQPRFEELVAAGLCTSSQATALTALVTERRNFLITGGTASGKTTLLTALLDLAASGERIVTIEDVAELRLAHDHVVALEARQATSEGVGEVTLERLLREALRMRPDRLVLGECRGPELLTLLTALNTGHDGGAGTLHASSLADVPARLEALGSLASCPPHTLARQVVSALHAVVHVERMGPSALERAGVRLGAASRSGHRIAAIGALRLDADGLLEVVQA